jgi:hypothetical protein
MLIFLSRQWRTQLQPIEAVFEEVLEDEDVAADEVGIRLRPRAAFPVVTAGLAKRRFRTTNIEPAIVFQGHPNFMECAQSFVSLLQPLLETF